MTNHWDDIIYHIGFYNRPSLIHTAIYEILIHRFDSNHLSSIASFLQNVSSFGDFVR